MLPGTLEWAGISLELTTWVIDLCSCFWVPTVNKVKDLEMYQGWAVKSGIVSFWEKKPQTNKLSVLTLYQIMNQGEMLVEKE